MKSIFPNDFSFDDTDVRRESWMSEKVILFDAIFFIRQFAQTNTRTNKQVEYQTDRKVDNYKDSKLRPGDVEQKRYTMWTE